MTRGSVTKQGLEIAYRKKGLDGVAELAEQLYPGSLNVRVEEGYGLERPSLAQRREERLVTLGPADLMMAIGFILGGDARSKHYGTLAAIFIEARSLGWGEGLSLKVPGGNPSFYDNQQQGHYSQQLSFKR